MNDQERITERLMATGEMDKDVTLTLHGWQFSALREAATALANAGMERLVEAGDIGKAMVAEANLTTILNGFTTPFFEQCSAKIREDGENQDLVLEFSVPLAAATAFTSLVVAFLTFNEFPKPVIPLPPVDDTTTVVSDSDMTWWALLDVVNQFPAPVLAVVTEETGLDLAVIA